MSDIDRANRVAKSLQTCSSISAMRDVLRSAAVNLELIHNGGNSIRRTDPEGAQAWDNASKIFWSLSKQLPETSAGKEAGQQGVKGEVDLGKLRFGS
jgi:hypothetical protein